MSASAHRPRRSCLYMPGANPRALEKAKSIVDRSLRALLEPGKSVDELMATYVMFGEDPFIRPTPQDADLFSARAYARQRAEELVNGNVEP